MLIVKVKLFLEECLYYLDTKKFYCILDKVIVCYSLMEQWVPFPGSGPTQPLSALSERSSHEGLFRRNFGLLPEVTVFPRCTPGCFWSGTVHWPTLLTRPGSQVIDERQHATVLTSKISKSSNSSFDWFSLGSPQRQ